MPPQRLRVVCLFLRGHHGWARGARPISRLAALQPLGRVSLAPPLCGCRGARLALWREQRFVRVGLGRAEGEPGGEPLLRHRLRGTQPLGRLRGGEAEDEGLDLVGERGEDLRGVAGATLEGAERRIRSSATPRTHALARPSLPPCLPLTAPSPRPHCPLAKPPQPRLLGELYLVLEYLVEEYVLRLGREGRLP